jgi:DNA polymerase
MTSSTTDPAELITWYAEMGVDVALGDVAVDRLAAPPAEPAPAAAPTIDARPQTDERITRPADYGRPAFPPAVVPPPLTPTTPAAAERAAADAAGAATTLDELRAAMLRFDGCALSKTATQLVFADGNPKARVMLVGEAPGRDEDIQGLPFVGRSGQLLDRMLAAIGLDRTAVYIANVVPWRPPGNRTPTPQETAVCRPFVMRQIELVDPDFLVCMGAPAAAELMGNTQGILKFRGQWKEFDTGTRKIRALATLHPAYLLRQPLQKRLAWRDLLLLRDALAGV